MTATLRDRIAAEDTWLTKGLRDARRYAKRNWPELLAIVGAGTGEYSLKGKGDDNSNR